MFFELGDVKQGNIVTVLRADHMLATFSVTSVAEYPKTAFPTLKVYGNTAGATLRLVTCGGRFDCRHQELPRQHRRLRQPGITRSHMTPTARGYSPRVARTRGGNGAAGAHSPAIVSSARAAAY